MQKRGSGKCPGKEKRSCRAEGYLPEKVKMVYVWNGTQGGNALNIFPLRKPI